MRYPAKFAVAMVTAALTVAAAMPIALADTAMPFEPDPKLSEDEPVDPTDPSGDPKPIVIRAYDMLRLYNRYADDHHYTMSEAERDALVEVGWSYEGIGWYSDDNETTPIYRQYNPFAVSGTHNYTPSKFENDELVKLGWKEEGIGWYGVEFTDEV